MAEKITKQWNADPNGEMVVKIYQEAGVKAAIRGFFQPTRTVDVPSGVVSGLYEPYPVTVKANQRVEAVKGDEVVMKG